MALEELGLKYNLHIIEFADAKQEPYLKLNPNGRLPTIEDPNTGITLWEVSSNTLASDHPQKQFLRVTG